MPLSVDEGYLFSLLDGVMTIEELCSASTKTPEQISEIINKLIDLGAVDLLEVSDDLLGDDEQPSKEQTGLSAPATTPTTALKKDDDEGELDPKLKQEIMGMRLHVEQSNFYQMLGVAPNADRAAIRKAYFDLSKRYHTDNYYKMQLGRYRPMMERIFGKITEAYETLSRKKRRAKYDEYIVDQIRAWEMERSLIGETEESKTKRDSQPPGHLSGEEGEAPGLELFRFAPIPQNQVVGAPVLPGSQPDAIRPPSAQRGAPISTPAPPPNEPPRAPSAPPPSAPPAAPPSFGQRSSSPAPAASQSSSLGPESNIHRKLREKRGRSALKALLGRKQQGVPTIKQKVVDPKAAFGVELELTQPPPGHTVEQGLAFRYAHAGLEALSINDLSAAVNAFEVSIQLDPNNEQVLDALAKVRNRAQGALSNSYERQGSYEEEMGKHLQAASSFLKALQHKSDDHNLMHRAALNLLRGDGDLKRARGLARSAVGAQPNDATYRMTLAEIYLKLGLEPEAGEELRLANRIEPGNDRVVRLMRGIGLEG